MFDRGDLVLGPFDADRHQRYLFADLVRAGRVTKVVKTLRGGGIMGRGQWNAGKRLGADVIIRGIRAMSDFEYEFEMNQLNRKLAPEIESVFVIASAEYSFLSSTGVKEMATFGGDVTDLVPDPVAAALRERLGS